MSRPPLPGPPPPWLMKLTWASAIAESCGVRLRSNSVEVTSRSFLRTMLMKPEPTKMRWKTRSTAGSFSMIAAVRSATGFGLLERRARRHADPDPREVEVERRLERHRQGREQHALDDEGAQSRADHGEAVVAEQRLHAAPEARVLPAISLGLLGVEAPVQHAQILLHRLARRHAAGRRAPSGNRRRSAA